MDKTKLMKKLDELTALAAAHDKRLEMTQVLDCFADEAVTPEEMPDWKSGAYRFWQKRERIHLRMKDFFWKKMGMILRIPYQN